MRTHESLGETKTFACAWCKAVVPKRRYDQTCCSKACALKHHGTLRPAWKDRPDREKQNAERNARYYANHEENKRKMREWRLAHPEETKEKEHKNYLAHKEKRLAATQAYRAAHPELRHKEYQNARQKRPWLMALINARHRSAKKKLAFDLTREWCEQKWTGQCAVSGLSFVFGTQTHFPFAPSIDRINSNEGYTQNNCRFVLFAINSFKGIGTDEQMLPIAEAIVHNLKLRSL